MRTVVVGAGVGGLTAAMAMARSGHEVTLLEKDTDPPPDNADQSFTEWARPGVPQRRLVHGILPLARRLLRAHAMDVVEQLHSAGAHDVDLLALLGPHAHEPGDEDLVALRCRRTVLEWVLRRQAMREPGLTVAGGRSVVGLTAAGQYRGLPKVDGVRLQDGSTVSADLVIDASGRSSKAPDWFNQIGAAPPEESCVPCRLVYYTRFYERTGNDAFPIAVRYHTPGVRVGAVAADQRNFSISFFVSAEVSGLRGLRHDDTFEAAAAIVPGVAAWRDGARPLAGVSAMGALDNRIRRFAPAGNPLVIGFLPLADSLSHTNPTLGRGMSLAFDHAFCAGQLAWTADNDVLLAAATKYHRTVDPMAEASHADAVDFDQPAEATKKLRDLLQNTPGSVLAQADPGLFRALVRATGLLAPPGELVREPWATRIRALETTDASSLPRGAGGQSTAQMAPTVDDFVALAGPAGSRARVSDS